MFKFIPHCNCHDKHNTQSKANISHDRVHSPPIYVEIFFPAALGTPMCVLYSLLERCWIGGGKRRRHWKTGSKTFCGCCLISSQMVGYISGEHIKMVMAISIGHWFHGTVHAMPIHIARSYYLLEASTPAIDISDSWGGDWDLNSATEWVDT